MTYLLYIFFIIYQLLPDRTACFKSVDKNGKHRVRYAVRIRITLGFWSKYLAEFLDDSEFYVDV